jgi:hypothetical protein
MGQENLSIGIILTNGSPLAYEVNFIKVEGIADN